MQPKEQLGHHISACQTGHSKFNLNADLMQGIFFEFFKHLCSIHQTDAPNLKWHTLPRKNYAKVILLKC